ncbi:transcription factor S [Candidatus Pyrohabitans sp.]
MFCDRCGGLMLPRDRRLICQRCGAVAGIENEDDYKIVSRGERKEGVVVVDEEVRTLPTTRAECPRCGNMEAEWWLLQTRKADEAETRFYRCTRCRYTWREYQ